MQVCVWKLNCLACRYERNGSHVSGPSDSSSFVGIWLIKMHVQILLRSFSVCCIVYKRNQQMVFVFPPGRIPKLTSVIWEKKNLGRNLGFPFYLRIPTSLMGDVYTQERLQPSAVEGLGEPRWTVTPGPLFRTLGGS